MTSLDPAQIGLADGLPDEPVALCAVAQGLIIEPDDAAALGVPEHRFAEKDIRPVSDLIDALTGLDPAPLHQAREPGARVVGTCRHFATLSCALLRLRGIPARVRCGFATYFVSGRNVDHWVTEYWHPDERRWVRVDTEILGQSRVARPEDLAVGEFLTGGEAWTRCRDGSADPRLFGVAGVSYAWGPAEIRGNAIRDLAALCKREMLPWDEWGRMTESYEQRTGPDYDLLIDSIAAACASYDPSAVARLYGSEDLAVPDRMIA
ncbi:MAG TPA: transglutaminase-like domain-containing protein [Mycobacteriales bacterium]|nr:transglutaminase-like domain-containing protein [Mycobacteriales bacterium]